MKEKALHHMNTALGIASPRNWHDHLFWIHFSMAELFRDEREYEDAHAQIEQARSHSIDNVYQLGRAMKLQAEVWYHQTRLEDAKSGALLALKYYEKAGAAHNAEICRNFLQSVERAMEQQPINPKGELMYTMLPPTFVNLHPIA